MRQPAVANRFYPGSARALDHTLKDLLPDEGLKTEQQHACAVISPHAGFVYSGALAARTIGSVFVPETVVIMGPNHHGLGAPVALSRQDWQMVSGSVTNNRALGDLLLSHSRLLREDETAHEQEHSLEVQIPFLQALQRNLSIVPIVLSPMSYELCQKLAASIATAINEYKQDHTQDVLLLASTDMSHYESRESGSKKDAEALQAIKAMKPEDLYNTVFTRQISMCGVIPVVVTLLASQMLGASSSRLIGYTDSGHVSGDTNHVVGYAGVVIDW